MSTNSCKKQLTMEKKNKICQSCMMPLSKDPQHGGTHSDGSKSTTYCSYCYQDGKFTRDFTLKEMHDFVLGKMTKMKYPKWLAKFMILGMPRLERWNSKSLKNKTL